MNIEDQIIRSFAAKSKLVGDDAAVVGSTLYSQDAFFEGVHFKRSWLTPFEIGYKAMMVNLSDAVAMNADPKFALLTLAIPSSLTFCQRTELIRGLRDAASLFKCEIIGGDTIANSKLDLSITIISQSKKPLYRHTVKEGDLLAFTGRLGQSKKDLNRLMRLGRIAKQSRFKRPVLRAAFIKKARKHLNGGLDISDGLLEDSRKLTQSIGRSFMTRCPVSKAEGCSGEEYEMLVSFSPKERKAVTRIAAQTRTPLAIFGKVKRCKKQKICRSNHF